MRQFSTNILGRVKETKVAAKEGYMALIEAVSNSIHAIGDRENSNGYIQIKVERDKIYQDDIISKIDIKELPIKNIEIIDNGIGFNEANFNSFMRCNSEYKTPKYGSKGIGRFTWLKVFDEVEITSIYKKNNVNEKISFIFKPIDQIDEKYEITEDDIKTKVVLKNLKNEYAQYFPVKIEDIAKLIINHFFINFIKKEIPKITIYDEYKTLNLNELFEDLNYFEFEKSQFTIYDKEFELYHIKTTTIDEANNLYFCANIRVVDTIDLRKYIKNLQSSIGQINSKKVWYFAYVCSSYLDEIVNSERTQLVFPKEDGNMNVCINISKETLIEKSCEEISKFLEKDLQKIEREKIERIDRYINTKRPNYKNLRSLRPDFYKNIESNLSDDKLELALFKEKLEWNKEINAMHQEILNKARTLDYDQLEILKKDYLNNVTQYGKDCLAEYIIKRKAILDMLDTYISKDKNDKYSLEEAVHALVCPLRVCSEQLDYNDMNLWLIDEKLAYHYYLASDKTMKSQLIDGEMSNKEPDLLIYNNPLLFNDTSMKYGYVSLTIIEFKKPMRNDYDDDKNPIEQVYGYIDEIRAGKKVDKNGRPLQGDLKNIPIYSYIIADVTPTLEKQCKMANLTKLPADDGFFGYSYEYKTFVQVMSYTKLQRDAMDRNRILFDTLFKD